MGSDVDFIASTLAVILPIALIFYGIFTAQVYFYFLEYDDDAAWLKIYVSVIWVVESVQSACCLHMIYTYLVLDFDDTARLVKIAWSGGVTIFLVGIAVAMVQGFYVYRAWKFGDRNCFVLTIPSIATLGRFVFCFGSGSLSYVYGDWVSFRDAKATRYTVNFGLVSGLLADIMIAFFLSSELYRARPRSYYQVHYLQRVTNWVIGTGVLATMCSVSVVFTFNVLRDSLIFAGLFVLVGQLYVNTMLANLNARKHIRRDSTTVRVLSDSFSMRGRVAKPTEVMKTTEIMTTTDNCTSDKHDHVTKVVIA